jgi:hypothetical protein
LKKIKILAIIAPLVSGAMAYSKNFLKQRHFVSPPPLAGGKRKNFNCFGTWPGFDAKPFFK